MDAATAPADGLAPEVANVEARAGSGERGAAAIDPALSALDASSGPAEAPGCFGDVWLVAARISLELCSLPGLAHRHGRGIVESATGL